MSTCSLPRVPLTWSFILCRGSHSTVTQLRVILSCEPSFLRSASGSWVDVLGANSRAPITGYLPWGISTFLSYHAHGSPWLSPSHGSYLFQGLPAVAWILHELGHPFLVLDLRPWSRLSLLFTAVLDCRGPKPLRWRLSPSDDASLWAMLLFGRRLERSSCWLILLGSLEGPPSCVDSDLRSTPDDGTVHLPPKATCQPCKKFFFFRKTETWIFFKNLALDANCKNWWLKQERG